MLHALPWACITLAALGCIAVMHPHDARTILCDALLWLATLAAVAAPILIARS